MRYIVFLFFGFGLMQLGIAQDLLEPSFEDGLPQAVTEESSESNFRIDQVETSSEDLVESVNLFSNRFSEADAVEIPDPTNNVQKSKVGFLMATGLEYIDEGEYEEAEKAYLRALEADAQNYEILFRLATLYTIMERYGDAIKILSELIEQFPENQAMHNNLAWCYAAGSGVKNKTLALRHAREALLSAPLDPSVWNTLAEAYYVAGDYEKALRAADQALYLAEEAKYSDQRKKSFVEQRTKILRSQKAMEMMDGQE